MTEYTNQHALADTNTPNSPPVLSPTNPIDDADGILLFAQLDLLFSF